MRDVLAAVLVLVVACWSTTAWVTSDVALGFAVSYGGESGVRVANVTPGSWASDAGLMPGARIEDLVLDDGTRVVVGGDLDEAFAELIGSPLIAERIELVRAVAGPTAAGGRPFVEAKRSDAVTHVRASGWALAVGIVASLAIVVAGVSGRFGTSWPRIGSALVAAYSVPLLVVPLQATGIPFALLAALFVLPGAALYLWATVGRPADHRWAIVTAGPLLLLATVGIAQMAAGGQYLDDDVVRAMLMGVSIVAACFSVRRSASRFGDVQQETIAASAVIATSVGVNVGLVALPFAALAVPAFLAWRILSVGPLLRAAERTQRHLDVAVQAAEEERRRLAADLHDDVLQDLSVVARRFDDLGDQQGSALAREVSDRLRDVCADLRQPMLDTLGAGPALEWLVERTSPLSESGIELKVDDPARPPADVELAMYRVAQEAISNAVRHGGGRIAVSYAADAGHARLDVRDRGPGIDVGHSPDQRHFGLDTMRQRADQIGARLHVGPRTGGGTEVVLLWPA